MLCVTDAAAGRGGQSRLRRRLSTRMWVGIIAAEVVLVVLVVAVVMLRRDYHLGEPRPDVLVLMIDALRADRLGCYGHHAPTSPFIDELARSSVVFENVRSQAPWTKPSIAGLFTGLYSAEHRVTVPLHTFGHRGEMGLTRRATLAPQMTTLAELFEAAGYRTAAFVANATLAPVFGYDQGFEQYVDLSRSRKTEDGRPLLVHNLPADQVNQHVVEYLSSRSPSTLEKRLAMVGVRRRPTLTYVHYMDVHGPYAPPPRFAALLDEHYRDRPDRELTEREVEALGYQPDSSTSLNLHMSRYDAQIRFLDRELRLLFAWLVSSRTLRDPIVVVTSDHGEAFGEHGAFLHGGVPYEEMVRVPLLLFGRDLPEGRRIATPVQLVDLAPTLLELAGLGVPDHFDGVSLLPLARGHTDRHVAVWSEVYDDVVHPLVCMVERGAKWCYDPVGQAMTEVYDLAGDPGETTNLLGTLPSDAVAAQERRMQGWFDERQGRSQGTGSDADLDVDQEIRDQLEALGYLDR
jgi:arylsulfatase A-like enzyme